MIDDSPDKRPSGLSRRSTFRASLRRVAKYRPWESADEPKRQVHHSNGQEAAPTRLPVVSLYSGREDTAMKRRRTEVRTADENLSPASKRNIDRLVKRFGPEVLETAKKRQLAKRKPLETIAPDRVSIKRRCSDVSSEKDYQRTGNLIE